MATPVLITLTKQGRGLGFAICGGEDDVHFGDDPGIFVTSVNPNGAAARDGRLQPGDKILKIDNADLHAVSHQHALDLFHKSGETVHLLVDRGAEERIWKEIENAQPQWFHCTLGRNWWNWLPVVTALIAVGVPAVYFAVKKSKE